MGYEHDRHENECGCVEHHTYDECCGMGPIAGTSKRWTEKCTIHGGTLQTKVQPTAEMQQTLADLEAAERQVAELQAEIQRKRNRLNDATRAMLEHRRIGR
jgi:hypothetical protein